MQPEREVAKIPLASASWVLMYGVEDSPLVAIAAEIRRKRPGLRVFGATSFQGVFAPPGFGRGVGMLLAEESDDIRVATSLKTCGASDAVFHAARAAKEVVSKLVQRPDALLLHATPGFEERILDGIREALGTEVPVYGGSAADDHIAGKWRVLADGESTGQGFLLVGIIASKRVRGSFLSGYLPSDHAGVVTRANGRTLHEIDGQPAAVVYNSWTGGAIASEVERGGNILLKTNLLPLARDIGGAEGLPRRLLSHPHEVGRARSLNLFSEFATGDHITLMTGAVEPLITRVRRSLQRAKGTLRDTPRGALLIYCGGSLGVILDQADRISAEVRNAVGDVPFLGIATFGEQGCFFEKSESRHGNLMCSAMVF